MEPLSIYKPIKSAEPYSQEKQQQQQQQEKKDDKNVALYL